MPVPIDSCPARARRGPGAHPPVSGRVAVAVAGLLALFMGPGLTPLAAQERAASPAFSPALALQTFDSVWSRVANVHYDPEMGGLDWPAVRAELEPRAREASSNAELRELLSEMVGRLGLSHFAIFGQEASSALEEAAGGGSAGADGEALANPGLTLRVVEGRLMVSRVNEGSPAARAGIRPGWVLLEIEGADPSDLPDELFQPPAATPTSDVDEGAVSVERLRALYLPSVALSRLQGPVGSMVEAVFLDAEDRRRTLDLERVAPPGQLARFGFLPPIPVEVTDQALPLPGTGAEDRGGADPAGPTAGWIRLSAWFPPATQPLAEAVDRHRESAGIILDLRGNPGGVGGMAMGVAGHFMDTRETLGSMQTRESTLNFVVSPQRISPAGERVDPFDGPLAILVDALSGSTSEIFAAGLQALGRARIFGEPSAGQVLPAVIIPLPNGDRFMHPIADFTAAGDLRLEGRGVFPDEAVPLTRAGLLAEGDPVLERALAWIADQARP